MKATKPDSNTPFWIDDFRTLRIKSNNNLGKINLLVRLLVILIFFSMSLYYLDILRLFKSNIVVWICAIYLLFLLLLPVWSHFNLKSKKEKIEKIQRRAYELTQASIIGSAIHVAGHPLLEPGQQVVIALVGDRLDIFDYSSPTPLCCIKIIDIRDIKTVSYDAERIPHTEIIDSAAQALKLETMINDKTYTCLFRRMKSVRPIDWYHRIQAVKMELEG